MVVAYLAGFVASLAALVLVGYAFDAAHFGGFAPPHWQAVTVACALLPLVGLAGLASVRAALLLRVPLVWVGGLGTWALAVYVVVFTSPRHVDALSSITGGPLAGLALCATVVGGAAVVLLIAGLLALRPTESSV
ncbi:MAG: hypothetical protein ABR941_07015 [Thermoleophilia bacterium]|jgi:hypothetical protein